MPQSADAEVGVVAGYLLPQISRADATPALVDVTLAEVTRLLSSREPELGALLGALREAREVAERGIQHRRAGLHLPVAARDPRVDVRRRHDVHVLEGDGASTAREAEQQQWCQDTTTRHGPCAVLSFDDACAWP